MPTFDIGTVFSRFFKLLGENFALFAIIGLIGIVLPSVAVSYGMMTYLGIPFGGEITSFEVFTPPNIGAFVGAILLLIVLNLIALSMITEVAIVRAVGKTADVGVIFGHALRNILPLLVISILVSLLVVFGFVLLIIPGIFLALCTCVAIPSYVGEPGRGIFGSISRSFELTKGRRWWILLIFIVIIIVAMIVGGIAGAITLGGMLSSGSFPQDPSGVPTIAMPFQLLSSAIDGVMSLLGTVFVAALYVCLRESRETLTPDNTAAVFS